MENVLVFANQLRLWVLGIATGRVLAGGAHERDRLCGSPGCPAALKFPSAPLGSDSGEKSALAVTQQRDRKTSVKGLVDH